MSLKDINIKMVIIILVITVVLLLSIKYIYNWYNLKAPLESFLGADQRIQNFALDRSKDVLTITLVLNNNFNELSETYNDIEAKLNDILKNKKYILQIKGLENENLLQVYYNMHFSLHENITKNNFIKLNDDINELASKFNISDYKIEIDEKNVYFMIRQNDNGLYKIFGRDSVNL